MLVHQTRFFQVVTPQDPHNDRLDGGHIKIVPLREMDSRADMTQEEAIEYVRLTMLVGQTYIIALNKCGIDVDRINYQDNGNYNKKFHLHLYGRAVSARYHKHGKSFAVDIDDKSQWQHFKPLTDSDIKTLQEEIHKQENSPKYDWS